MALPVKGRGFHATVDGLVSRLSTPQTKSIVAPQATAPGDYGTRQTRHYDSARIRPHRRRSSSARAPGKASSTPRINRGRRSSRSNRPWPMTAGHRRLSAKGSLRWPRLRRRRPGHGGQTDVRENQKRKQGRPGRREVEADGAGGEDVDQSTVDNLISAITAARATSFVEGAAKTGWTSRSFQSHSRRMRTSVSRRSVLLAAAPMATQAATASQAPRKSTSPRSTTSSSRSTASSRTTSNTGLTSRGPHG